MKILDASLLIAFITGEQGGERTRELLREERCGIAATNLAESVDVLLRIHGATLEELQRGLKPVFAHSLTVIPLDEHIAWRAGEIRARRIARKKRPISHADAVLLATPTLDDLLVTQDEEVVRVAKLEQIPCLPKF